MKKRVKFVDDIMHEITSIEGSKSIKDAAKLMTIKKIGSLIVKNNKKIFGIVTEKDIVESIASGIDVNTKVQNISVRKIHSVESGTEIIKIGELFDKYHIRRLPVKKEGKIIGIITIKDFVEAIPMLYSDTLNNIKNIEKTLSPD